MSKRLGNFYTVRDLVARGADPLAIRWELFKAHYRSNMNFTLKGLEDSTSAVRKLRDRAAEARAQSNGGTPVVVDRSHPLLAEFGEMLGDDLNVSGALGAVFRWLSHDAKDPGEIVAVLEQVDRVLGVLEPAGGAASGTSLADDDAAAELCHRIDAARKAKDFGQADLLRKQLVEAGYEVMTTKEGTSVRKKLA